MDALIGAPVSTQPQPPGGSPTSPLIPGQVVSARVVQALAADTFLLAVRGQTLVAQSPTPLPLDTVVQLAVSSGGAAGEPVSVRLLPAGSPMSPVESAPALLSARTIAVQLGLPDSDLSAQLVAACQRQGVPLRPATVAPLLRLLQEAQEPLSVPATKAVSDEPSVTTGATASASGLRAVLNAVTSSSQTVATNSKVPLPASDSRETLVAGLQTRPANAQTPAVVGAEPRSTPAVAAHMVGRLPERFPDIPIGPASASRVPLPATGTPLPRTSGPAIVFVPTFAAGSLATARSTADPVATRQIEGHVETADAHAPKSALPVHSEAITARVTPELAVSSRTPGSSLSRTSGGPVAALPVAGSSSEVPTGLAPEHGAERSRQTPGDTRPQVQPLQRAWSPGAVRAVAALPVETRMDAVARLAASPLPPSAALLPLAVIAVQGDLPRTAHLLPQRTTSPAPPAAQVPAFAPAAPPTQPIMSGAAAVVLHSPVPAVMASRVTIATAKQTPVMSSVLAPVPLAPIPLAPIPLAPIPLAPMAPTSMRMGTQETAATLTTRLPALPFRESIDLARGPDPRPAIRQGFSLAGLVVRAHAHEQPVEPPSLERLLTSLLTRVAASARHGAETVVTATATATAAARSTVPAPGIEVAGAPGARHQAPPRAPDEALGLPAASTVATDPAPAFSVTGNELTAVHEQVARDLLPPPDLTEYDRVLALPLAIAGQPLPARLAVTTRHSANGTQACWMRLDCELSRLGPVSVRLGGVEGAPVAITLVARPAAAAELAAALPQLTHDLHQLGVEAAVRVVAEDEVSS